MMWIAAAGTALAAWSPGFNLQVVPLRSDIVQYDGIENNQDPRSRFVGGLEGELERRRDGPVGLLLGAGMLAERVAWDHGRDGEDTFAATGLEPRAFGAARYRVGGKVRFLSDFGAGIAVSVVRTSSFSRWDVGYGPLGLLGFGIEGGEETTWRVGLRGSGTASNVGHGMAVDGKDYGYIFWVRPANLALTAQAGLSF